MDMDIMCRRQEMEGLVHSGEKVLYTKVPPTTYVVCCSYGVCLTLFYGIFRTVLCMVDLWYGRLVAKT